MALNNSYNRAFDQYRENTVFTSTPEELTLMLYNGIVKFIMQAKVAIDENHIERANNSILRAQDIICELQSSLDMKYEISNNLMLLYDYMYRQLMESNIKKDKNILEEVLNFAKELRDTWMQAMKMAKKQNRIRQVKTSN
ncbi:MAG TPA: flagellar export chaperone FliS [Clostridiaceae bacterium]|jgi:flagellar protein FliS|nr:flagellar export chaperone FliS [Clostridiaceae bacterium]